MLLVKEKEVSGGEPSNKRAKFEVSVTKNSKIMVSEKFKSSDVL